MVLNCVVGVLSVYETLLGGSNSVDHFELVTVQA